MGIIREFFAKQKNKKINRLINALKSENKNTCLAAINSLARIGTPAINALIDTLSNEDYCDREIAAWALGDIGNVQAVESLIVALQDEIWQVRKVSIEALAKISQLKLINSVDLQIVKQVFEPMSAMRKDKDWRVRNAVNEELAPIFALISKLRDTNCNIRKIAGETLEKIGWQPKDDQEKAFFLVAVQNWEEACKLGNPAVQPLIAALGDFLYDIREAATRALIKIGNPAKRLLSTALKDKNWHVRKAVARVLKTIGWQPMNLSH